MAPEAGGSSGQGASGSQIAGPKNRLPSFAVTQQCLQYTKAHRSPRRRELHTSSAGGGNCCLVASRLPLIFRSSHSVGNTSGSDVGRVEVQRVQDMIRVAFGSYCRHAKGAGVCHITRCATGFRCLAALDVHPYKPAALILVASPRFGRSGPSLCFCGLQHALALLAKHASCPLAACGRGRFSRPCSRRASCANLGVPSLRACWLQAYDSKCNCARMNSDTRRAGRCSYQQRSCLERNHKVPRSSSDR